ncbi:MAG: hypothetical protein HC860_27500 [Alkalinema sp. RU_4_3]|nr:hypothetical protein [Alkalinema sp. RU_4_3]
MEFKVSEAKARAMARLEREAGCDISAGPDYGIHLGKVMELALHPVDQVKFIDLLYDQLGNVLSREEIEEVASSFQAQIQLRLAEKEATRQSA